MKTKTQHIERRFQRHVSAMNGTLPVLVDRIEHMPRLQVTELQDRLHHVEVMEHAMRRNIHEVLEAEGMPEVERVRKLKSLALLIEAETESLRHEADFIGMGYNNSLEAVAKGTDKLIRSARDLFRACGSWLRKR
jgi:hypothetical protein